MEILAVIAWRGCAQIGAVATDDFIRTCQDITGIGICKFKARVDGAVWAVCLVICELKERHTVRIANLYRFAATRVGAITNEVLSSSFDSKQVGRIRVVLVMCVCVVKQFPRS